MNFTATVKRSYKLEVGDIIITDCSRENLGAGLTKWKGEMSLKGTGIHSQEVIIVTLEEDKGFSGFFDRMFSGVTVDSQKVLTVSDNLKELLDRSNV